MHSLQPYSVRIYDSEKSGPQNDRYLKMDSVRGTSLADLWIDFLTEHQCWVDTPAPNENKKLRFGEPVRSGQYVSGWVEVGGYGMRGKIVDVVETGEIRYVKRSTDADISQLYYCLSVPEDKTTCVLLLHSINGHGAKTVIEYAFADFLYRRIQLKPQIRPLTAEAAVNEWMENASVKKLRATRFTGQIEGKDEVDHFLESAVEVTYVPKKRGNTFGPLKNLARQNRSGEGGEVVNLLENMSSDVKAEAELNGRKRIFRLAQEEPVSSIDIDDDDVQMEEGVPFFNSIDAYAKQWVADLETKI